MLNLNKLNNALNLKFPDTKNLNIFFKNHMSSTNDYISYKYIRDLCPVLILTNNQRSARGRRNKQWYCLNNKSLSFSLCIKIKKEHTFFRCLSYMVCLSLFKAIEETSKNSLSQYLRIKWPNDIYYDGKKISGILIESIIDQKDVYMSIGIGLNLYLNSSDLSKIDQPSTNIPFTNTPSKEEIIESFTKFLYGYLYGNKKFINSIDEYNNYLLWINKKVKIKDKTSEFTGELIGINKNGYIQLKKNNDISLFDDIDMSMEIL